ncbi:formyltransferase family protein [Acinetobacter tandoii]
MAKIMIVGQKWLAEKLLEHCILNQFEVVAVAAPVMNDRLAIAANRFCIPVRIAPVQLDSNDVPIDTDLILCAHAHCYVTTEARKKSRLGALGYHPSLLPKYKGRNAVQDTIDHGEPIAGGSLYWLDDGWDTGTVQMQRHCEVDPLDDAASLWRNKLAPLGVDLFAEFLTLMIGSHSV